MFARSLCSLASLLLVVTTGCGIPEMIGGGIALHRAHELKEDRKALAAGHPRPWVEYINDVRDRGTRFGEYWEKDEGWVGERSKPYFDAYRNIYSHPDRTVTAINKLNDGGKVSKEEMQKYDLYEHAHALRWLIARYKETAAAECVEAHNAAQSAANRGITEHGEPVAAAAYKRLLQVIESMPDEPRVSSLHYAQIVGLPSQ